MIVTVLMPVFNAEKYVEESVQSIVNQTYQSWNLIICDDASTDKSLKIISRFNDPRITVIRNARNLGYLRTMNILFGMVDTELAAFQDADDISHPERFSRQVELFERNADIVVCGTNFSVIDPTSKVVKSLLVETDPGKIKKMMEKDNCFQKPSIMFRSHILRSIGGYREEFLQLENISEDYDWLLRINEKHIMTNINHSESLYLYRSIPTAISKNAVGYRQLFGHQVAQWLYNQRVTTGIDCLMSGDLVKVKEFIKGLEKPYIEDRSMFYRERASSHLSFGLAKDALKYAVKAIAKNPFKFHNYRILRFSLLRLVGLK